MTSKKPGVLHISWPLKSFKGNLVMELDEKQIKMKLAGAASQDWFLELTTDAGACLPFQQIGPSRIDCTFEGTDYDVTASKGTFSKPNGPSVFRITPQRNTILLNLTGEHAQR